MSGYVSVGHVFEVAKEQSNIGYKLALGKLVDVIYGGSDQTVVNEVGLRQFDKYFTRVQVAVESTITYLRDILKHHDFEDLDFQLIVEHDVFHFLFSDSEFNEKFRIYREFGKKKRSKRVIFQLFCLFNRFCDTEKIPMTLNYESLNFVLHKCGIPSLKTTSMPFTFLSFVEHIYNNRHGHSISLVKAPYDELCRDVLIENRMSFCIRSKLEEPQLGKAMVKFVSLTSFWLKIHEDESNNSNDRKLKGSFESEAKVVLKIPIMFSTYYYKNEKEYVDRRFTKKILSITSSTSKIALDLIFDAEKEKSDFITWKKCLDEAKEICHNKINRLQQAQNTVSFLAKMNASTSSKSLLSRSSEDLFDNDTDNDPIDGDGRQDMLNELRSTFLIKTKNSPPIPARNKTKYSLAPPPIPGKSVSLEDLKSVGVFQKQSKKHPISPKFTNVTDFCFSSRTEKEKLMKDLTSGIPALSIGSTLTPPAHHSATTSVDSSSANPERPSRKADVRPPRLPAPSSASGANPYLGTLASNPYSGAPAYNTYAGAPGTTPSAVQAPKPYAGAPQPTNTYSGVPTNPYARAPRAPGPQSNLPYPVQQPSMPMSAYAQQPAAYTPGMPAGYNPYAPPQTPAYPGYPQYPAEAPQQQCQGYPAYPQQQPGQPPHQTYPGQPRQHPQWR